MGSHRSADGQANGKIVQGNGCGQHHAGSAQVMVPAGAVMGISLVFVVGTFVDPAVQEEDQTKAYHQEDGGEVVVAAGVKGFGQHIQRHDAYHQAGGKGNQQAGDFLGFPLQKRGQKSTQRQPARTGEQGEQHNKNQGFNHVCSPINCMISEF